MDEFFKGDRSQVDEELLAVLVWCGRVGHGWVGFQRLFRLHLFKPQFSAHSLQKFLPLTAVHQNEGRAFKPPADIYAVCLQKYVRTSLYSPSHTLYYTAGDKYTHSEVPACSIDLSLPPNSCYRVIIEDTEPNNNITVAGEEIALTIVYHEVQPSASETSEFLAREELLTIQSKNFPFRAE